MSTDTAFDDADLNAFVDGRIEPSRAALLAESLASDPEARARIDAWKRQNESLRTMFASVLFEPVPVRLLPAPLPPRAAQAGPVRSGEPAPAGRLAGVVATTSLGMALIGFALGALVGVGTDGFGLSPHAAGNSGARDAGAAAVSPARTLAERAAEAHRTFVGDTMRPVELTAAEQPRLLRWIQHRLGATLRIPDLARLGWTLVGGRIVPGPDGPAAFLLYGNGADRLGLSVARTTTADGIATLGRDPVGVTAWADDDFGYALTTDHGREWLERNAAPLRESVRAQVRGEMP